MPPDPALVEEAKKAALANGIPVDLFLAQITQESGWNPRAENPAWPVSKGGPAGIAQITRDTAQTLNVDPYDPVQSIWGAAAYDRQLYGQTNSWEKTLQRYGTLPTTGALSSGQQTVADIARGADTGASGGTSTVPPNAVVPVGGPGGGATPAGFPGQSIIQSAFSWIYNIFIRAILVLVGIVLIWQGLAMMRETTIKNDVIVIRDRLRRKK